MRRGILSLLVLVFCCSMISAQQITTIGGGGPNDVPAGSANMVPVGVAVRGSDLYIASGSLNRVYKVDSSDQLTVFAGNGIPNSDGDGGLAAQVGVLDPRGIVLDAAGNMWIGEFVGRVRKVNAGTGIITTVAGSNSSGFGGDNGPATSAMLRNASGVALDPQGNLFIADTNNHRIRRVEATTGIITTYAGNGMATYGGDNGPATSASIRAPQKVAIDKFGNLFIADTLNHRIRRVDAVTRTITTVAGNGTAGFSGDSGPATLAMLRSPSDVAVDAAGNLWIADTLNGRVRQVDTSGIISTFNIPGLSAPASIAVTDPTLPPNLNMLIVGDTSSFKVKRANLSVGCCTEVGNGLLGFSGEGIVATKASFRFPNNLAFDGAGNVYVADSSNNRIRRIAAGTGIVTTFAGGGSPPPGTVGDGGLATDALLNSPTAIAFDALGNLFVADQNNFRIRRIDGATGIITTVAGIGLVGFMGDTGPATSARINQVTGVAVDSLGNMFLADRGNQRIRRVDGTTGIITTFAGTGTQAFGGDGGPALSAPLSNPGDVAVDTSGNVFIADTANNRVRRVDKTTLVITTVAGGGANTNEGVPAIQASIDATGVKVDNLGNIFIASSTRNRIRRVDAITQTISTVAGNGQFLFTGDGGPAISAGLANPTGVAIDATGNLAIADNNNHRVRLVFTANNVPSVTFSGNTTIDEGSAFTAAGSFTDDSNSWTATVNYGDGTGTAALPLNPNKTFNLNHIYADNGAYTVVVAVDDGAGGHGTATATVNVLNVSPLVNAGGNASVNEGATFTQAGSFSDPGSDTWNGMVDFGDGSAVQALTLGANKTFNLSHAYSDSGTYPVTVWVADDDSGVGNNTIQVNVNNVAPAIVSLAASATSIQENDSIVLSGSISDAGTNDSHRVTIKWGDGSTDTSLNLAPGELTFSASHKYLDDAPSATSSDVVNIAVTVADSHSGSGTGNTSITIQNVAPVISQITGPTSVPLGSVATFAVNYSDIGSLDTHSCIFNWNDGQANGSAGSCSVTHTYATAGTYTVGVTVVDDDMGSARSTYSVQVVISPTTGSVTGGGWINSPAGAFTKEPSLTGKANFGFNSKYLNDGTVLTGQTEFNFKMGSLNFHSTSYEWLVISGNQAQYKGSATINGSGYYGFMVTVIDGNDAFRMMIWDKRTGAVIYDNSLGQPNPQPIGGGNITVHSN